jgi:Ser-tRNA(Ala) deacylase AlaX
MTLKRFWSDPYLTRLDTVITAVNGPDVTVAETIFYAFSGGQESDSGTIGGRPVLEARKDGLEIIYTLPEDHGLRPGDPVTVAIDWTRRYRLMRLHFAAEIVLELVYRALPAVSKVGAHIAPDKARLDFEWPQNISGLIPDLEAQAQAIIDADHPILSTFSDEAAEKRTWEIAGFARVPCGGTHLHRTGEVGRIALKRRNPGKGKERIEVMLIEDAPA